MVLPTDIVSSQLTWTCPICRVKVLVTSDLIAMNCVCGSKVLRDGTVEVCGQPNVPLETLTARQDACDECAHHGNVRCVLIDAGCRRTYLSRLYAADGQCPLGLW